MGSRGGGYLHEKERPKKERKIYIDKPLLNDRKSKKKKIIKRCEHKDRERKEQRTKDMGKRNEACIFICLQQLS